MVSVSINEQMSDTLDMSKKKCLILHLFFTKMENWETFAKYSYSLILKSLFRQWNTLHIMEKN